MPDFRRFYIPNAIYFITAVTRDRCLIFQDKVCMDALFDAMRYVRSLHPFRMLAYAALWDHVHLLLQPKPGTNISQIMHSIKRGTTFRIKALTTPDEELHLWQDRFWDHIIRDQDDLNRHLDYIHYNPLKHGYVIRPEDWLRSSHAVWLARGYYERGWGHHEPPSTTGMNLE
jgi:putative transposase